MSNEVVAYVSPKLAHRRLVRQAHQHARDLRLRNSRALVIYGRPSPISVRSRGLKEMR